MSEHEGVSRKRSAAEALDLPLPPPQPAPAVRSASAAAAAGPASPLEHFTARPRGESSAQRAQPAASAPARQWSFKLDPFQEAAIACVEQRESVMVAAHTSSGKTVVAEYAIALALREKSRVIYTAPIKALSNQKFRELKAEFTDVGLLTGDVMLNPSASCLVMTTEILRNMLYRGSEVLREVSWVIFDEIHYLRDRERGVVWEESIILLPPQVNIVFLSATVANPREFAQWVADLKHRPCHVVSTTLRPTPLHHFLFPAGGGSGLTLVLDERGVFQRDAAQRAFAEIGRPRPLVQVQGQIAPQAGPQQQRVHQTLTDCVRLVHELQRSDLLPCIFFSFRRRECEGYALELREMDFTSAEEKALIAKVFHNAMASLDDADRELPQIRSVLPLLLRGIGVHHSGLVPIVKEVIELLFQETLVKVLFATETFALGVNMPARTVVFTSLRKFDGRERRDITSGEYIQMSGRAGRRGLDARGVSIVMVDSTSDPATCEQVLCGEPNRLVSRFRISFNLILNMTRMQSLDMEAVLANSYHQFLLQLREPELEARIAEVAARVRVATERWPPPPEPSFEDAAEFARLERLLASAHARCASLVLAGASHVLLPFLQPGRVVYVGDAENEFGWGVVLGLRLQYAPDRFVVDVLVRVAGATALSLGGKDSLWVPSGWPSAAGPPPAPPSTAQSSTSSTTTTTSSSSPPRLEVVAVQPSMLQRVSVVRMLLPYELRSSDAKRRLFADMERVLHGNPCWGLPTLHPAAHLGLAADHAAVAAATRVSQVEELLAANPLARLERGPRDAVRRAARERADLESQLAELRRRGRRAELATFQSELKSRRSVLRRMQYVDEASGALLPKGRVACEIEACDELVLTELIFDGFFSARDVPSSVALLSCLFPNERGGAGADSAQQAMAAALVPAGANEAVAQMRATARRVAEAMRGANMDVDVGDLVARVDPVLLPVAYQWCCGKSFGEICALTTLFEGNIIRTFRRMADLLQQLVLACKSLGNAELEGKFAEGARLLLRGVLGTASLYTVA